MKFFDGLPSRLNVCYRFSIEELIFQLFEFSVCIWKIRVKCVEYTKLASDIIKNLWNVFWIVKEGINVPSDYCFESCFKIESCRFEIVLVNCILRQRSEYFAKHHVWSEL